LREQLINNINMKKQLQKIFASLVISAGAFAACAVHAGEAEHSKREIYSLQGQHQFTITGGTLVDDDYIDNQDVGSFEYSYWFSECASFTLAMGGITSEDHDSFWHDHHYDEGDDGVGMVLVGMQLRPEFLNLTDRVFFTLEGLVGPYVGVDEYWREDEYDAYRHGWDEETETQWGAYLGVNLNIAVTHRFLIGASAGYHFVDEFETAINGETDFNSPEFRLRFSFVL
jgi:hypothetical protein